MLSNLNKYLAVWVLAMVILVVGCGGGSGKGPDSGPTPPISVPLYFPTDADLSWYYNDSNQACYFDTPRILDKAVLNVLVYPTGGKAYYTTDEDQVALRGIFSPLIQVPQMGNFTADTLFDESILLWRDDLLPGSSWPVDTTGTSEIDPTYGVRPIRITGQVEYHGVVRLSVPMGQFDARHISFSISISLDVAGQSLTIPFNGEIWLTAKVGIVRRIENGTVFDLTDLNGPDSDHDGVVDALDAFPDDPLLSRDTDGDGIADEVDPDDDNDGVADAEDPFPTDPDETSDFDGDGTGDNADTDDDNDGTPDVIDPHPLTRPKAATIYGNFLAVSPPPESIPIKILLAIDCSGSMGIAGSGTDPDNQRLTAAMDFVTDYTAYPNVSFEILLWNQGVVDATRVDGDRGFTGDTANIETVLTDVFNIGQSDYVNTLEAIRQDIGGDILKMDDPDALVRTRYIVIFLTDGPDSLSTPGGARNVEILNRMDALYEFVTEDHGIRHFNFHTILLPNPGMTVQDREDCIQMLMNMAHHGVGDFSLFTESVDFEDIADVPVNITYLVKSLLVYNLNVLPRVDVLQEDSDGDGLTDVDELNPPYAWWHPTDPMAADTDADGLSDLCELKISTPDSIHHPTVADSPQCQQLSDGTYADTDQDGMHDCEEEEIGSDPRRPDTDQDGITDLVEFLTGSDPLQAWLNLDSDFDGASDLMEILHHTDVDADDPVIRARFAYAYRFGNMFTGPLLYPEQIDSSGLNTAILNTGNRPSDGRTAMFFMGIPYDFTVSNIAVLDTSGSVSGGSQDLNPGDNRVRLLIGQVPEDHTDAPPITRVAEVVLKYDDPTHQAVIAPGDFNWLD